MRPAKSQYANIFAIVGTACAVIHSPPLPVHVEILSDGLNFADELYQPQVINTYTHPLLK